MQPEKPLQILLVDDKEANLIAAERVLSVIDNVEIVKCQSGTEALSAVLKGDFSVILLDVNMPGLSGYETIELIRGTTRYKDIPILLLTASHPDANEMSRAYEQGATDYLLKPIDSDLLRNKVKVYIELEKSRRSLSRAYDDLQQISSKNEIILTNAGEGILGIDVKGKITFANPKACQLLEIHLEKILDHKIQDFFTEEVSVLEGRFQVDIAMSPLDLPWQDSPVGFMFSAGEDTRFDEDRWVTKSGNEFAVEFSCSATHDSDSGFSGGVVMFQNITARKKLENDLMHLANYDPLTNIANRAYFYDALVRTLARAERGGTRVGLLFIDLDHFKAVNDNLGHHAGDILLTNVADRIKRSIRDGDLVARLGGDEFAVIIYDLTSIQDAKMVSEAIIKQLDRPHVIDGMEIVASPSIGIALYPEVQGTVEELIKAADTAMYAAKRAGRNNYQFFSEEVQKMAEEKSKIENKLSLALSNHEFSLEYQPKISVGQKKIIGFEALIRWYSEGVNWVSPETFIPIAEESGSINAIGEWVLHKACEQMVEWQSIEPAFLDLVLSINVSPCQLQKGNFCHQLEKVIEKTGLAAKCIEIEVTETAVMSDPDTAIAELEKIAELGVQISVDDFGTGYSCLEYLKRLPIDTLKIDRAFVSDIGVNKEDESIVKAVIAIAHSLEIDVIAEGVETVDQLAFLKEIDCDLMQGFYFSRPVPADRVIALVKHHVVSFEKQFEDYSQFQAEQQVINVQGRAH